MFLASMLLIVIGSVLMWVYEAPAGAFAFVIGLFVVMGGAILFAISLNYGPPPDTRPLPPVDRSAPLGAGGSSGSP